MSLRISSRSTILAQRRFYLDTYLRDDDTGHVWLIVVDAAEVRGPSGRVWLRTDRDVVEFDNTDLMVDAITDGGWVEADSEDRDWEPRLSQLASA